MFYDSTLQIKAYRKIEICAKTSSKKEKEKLVLGL